MEAHAIIPIVALLVTFGMPVAIVYVIKHFRFKERELSLEAGLDAEEKYQKLEAKLDRVEKMLGSMQAEMRQLPPAPKADLYLPPHRDESKG
jgi:hypothetical protein